MKKTFVTIFQYIFFFGLGVLFVWLTVRHINHSQWEQIKASIRNARHWLILPAVITLLSSHYLRALRWRILMEPLGFHPTKFNTWAAVMIGYLVNAGVPRLGEVVKCTLLAKYEKVRADKLVGTIVMERAVDIVGLVMVFAIALFLQGHIFGEFLWGLFGDFFKDKTGHTSYTKMILFFASLILFLVILYYILKRFGHIDAVAKVKKVVKGIWHGLSSIRLIKHKGWFLFHSVMIWILYLASTTMGIYALRETAHLGLMGGLTTLAIGSVGMIITPGGIGAYPLLVAKLMELYGLDFATTGTALGWLLWSVQTLIILIGGVIFSGLFTYHNKKTKVESRQQHTT
ncbi:MAG: hypothetical protein C4329_05885 [Chitinophagaceae bacterium]